MKARFAQLTGLSVAASGYDRIHRWRYASTEKALGQPYLWDDAIKLGAIGDWCTGSKVEDAFMSGHRMVCGLIGSVIFLKRANVQFLRPSGAVLVVQREKRIGNGADF